MQLQDALCYKPKGLANIEAHFQNELLSSAYPVIY
jgi:hypothetical protein